MDREMGKINEVVNREMKIFLRRMLKSKNQTRMELRFQKTSLTGVSYK